MKEGIVQQEPSAPDMGKINRYTRRAFGPEEVYTFSLVLCDNEVDRDQERFSLEALKGLRELFLGKTILFDHQRSSASQTARIYDTGLEEEPGRVTQGNEPYTKLTAKAYLPRTGKNQEVIELIESGILKEVSVGCSMGSSVCSICGKETCSHVKGKTYGGKRCHRVLSQPQDAYECSFVAVPAQRAAGVVKQYQGEQGGNAMDVIKCLESAGEEGVQLTSAQAREFLQQVKQWQEQARWGRSYREKLEGDVLKYSAVLQPQLPRGVMESAVEGMPLPELAQMAQTYEKMAGEKLPLRPQLAPGTPREKTGENGEFRI